MTYHIALNLGRADKFLWDLSAVKSYLFCGCLIHVYWAVHFQVRIRQTEQYKTCSGIKYGGFIAGCLFIGYITSRPVLKFYYDATENKQHTLTPNSQKILSQIKGDLTMTSYVNLMDKNAALGC